MLFLSVVLLGLISFFRLPIDLLPDVSYPRLVVYTSYPDVAPAEVERLVTQRIEAQAAAVPGVERVTSVSREGVSLVTLRFAWGTDMDFATLDLRERLDNVRDQLPESAARARPRILRVDPESEPILALSVTGGADLWQTKELTETVIRRRLEQLEGVAEAAVTGGLDREIQVEVDPELIQAYSVTLEQIESALSGANYSAPGGTILRGRYRYPLRTLGEFQTVDEIQDVVVARQTLYADTERQIPSGTRLVRVRDVAQVTDGFADRESVARYAGAEAVGLLVFKESGANTVSVARDVAGVLEQLRGEYPTLHLDVASTQAEFISESISNVVQALILGGLLAFLVLFFFLRDPRYPVGVALAIPISVIGTFSLMEAFDVSLNIMSLGGLALGVGMLVDNSIVVLENIFRHRELGASPQEAAALGAEEVQGAITASTLTTVAVFGPIIYVEGVAGELFADLSLTVAFSLMMSLLVALTLLPAVAARFGTAEGRAAGLRPRPYWAAFGPSRGRLLRFLSAPVRFVRWLWALVVWLLLDRLLPFARALLGYWGGLLAGLVRPFTRRAFAAFDRGYARFERGYHRLLERALDRKAAVVGSSVAALAMALLLGVLLDRDVLPQVDQGSFTLHLALEQGTSLEATTAVATRLEEELLADPDVEAVFTQVGRDVRAYAESDEDTGLHTATLQVRLRPHASTAEVAERARHPEVPLPLGALSVREGEATALGRLMGGADADIAVRIRGEDLEGAYRAAQEIESRLAAVPSLGNVRIGQSQGRPQYQVEVLREQAARYGIEPRAVAETVERAMRGARATEYVDFDRKINVIVRLPDDYRFSIEALDLLRVQGVPLKDLVRVREALAPSEVRREDQGRVTTVLADVVGGGLDGALEAVQQQLAGLTLARGLRVEVGGENEEMRRSFRDLAFAFLLALLLVYMILAAQFESFAHPFTILTAVPLALVGAVLALGLTGGGLNTMSLIGVVILVGIVVNDSIVKVDFIRQARQRGAPLREAILEAGRVRLRPILMTTITTVLGLLPMALGIGRGADLRAPLAIAVIGGLTVATLLTLVVVPVVYAIVETAFVVRPVPVTRGDTAEATPVAAAL